MIHFTLLPIIGVLGIAFLLGYFFIQRLRDSVNLLIVLSGCVLILLIVLYPSVVVEMVTRLSPLRVVPSIFEHFLKK